MNMQMNSFYVQYLCAFSFINFCYGIFSHLLYVEVNIVKFVMREELYVTFVLYCYEETCNLLSV